MYASNETKTLAVLAMVFSIICPIVGLICAIIGVLNYQTPNYKKISVIALITSIVWPILMTTALLTQFVGSIRIPG